MSCSDFDQQIALYVGEDLSAVERGEVERHLKQCSNCWDLAEEIKESQSVFKSIRQDVPDSAALSALRERVLSEVAGLERLNWFERLVFGGLRGKAALAGMVIMVIGGTMWLTRSPAALTPASGVQIVRNTRPENIAIPVPEPPAVAPQRRPARRERRPLREPRPVPHPEEPKQTTIKLFTDDPNVIIYWLVDEKGD